jgi:hypothetical protein
MASEFVSLELQKSSFQIVYTGSALNGGTLDVADFAPAILALERLLQEINLRVNDNNSTVSLGIVSIEQGSVIATFILRLKKARENITTLYHSDSPDDLNKLLSILKNGGGIIAATAGGIYAVGASIFWVISQIHSAEPPKVEKQGNTVIINEIKNNYRISISRDTYEMANNQVVMQEAAKVVQPLTIDGVDGFYVRDNSSNNSDNIIYQRYQITKNDLDAFPIKDIKEELQQEVDLRQVLKSIQTNSEYSQVARNLPEIKKETIYHKGPYAIIMVPNSNLEDAWQLKGEMKGGRKFSAHIKDQDFLNMIRNKSIVLSEHDSIIARVTQSFQGSRSKYEVTEVTDYIPGGIKTIAQR